MGVAVADDLEVEVVGLPAAGEHRVQLLPGLLPGQQAVHRVGGDALGRMDGGGIAKTGRGTYIVDRQPDGQVAAGVSDGQVTVFGDVSDGPAVAVFDPVGGGESESAVVAAGDDHISDTGPVPVGQTHLGRGSGVIETMPLARRLSSATSCRVGAIMIASSPPPDPETQALNASSVVVAMSPTWTRP